MNGEQEQALLESIEHWKENVALHTAGKNFPYGAKYCPCCQLQGKRQDLLYCFQDCFHDTGNCVIAEYTGAESCNRTPYYKVVLEGKEPPQVMLDWLQQLYDFLTGKAANGPELYEDDV
jgi:hypothetical protein